MALRSIMSFVNWLIDKFRRRARASEAALVPSLTPAGVVLVASDPPEWEFPFADADFDPPPARPPTQVAHVPSNASSSSAVECSICLEDDSGDGCTEYKLSCGHGFHEKCVGPWVSDKGTCPLCRTSVTYSGTFGSARPPQPSQNRPEWRPPPSSIFVTPPEVRSRLVPIQTNDGDNRNYMSGMGMYVT